MIFASELVTGRRRQSLEYFSLDRVPFTRRGQFRPAVYTLNFPPLARAQHERYSRDAARRPEHRPRRHPVQGAGGLAQRVHRPAGVARLPVQHWAAPPDWPALPQRECQLHAGGQRGETTLTLTLALTLTLTLTISMHAGGQRGVRVARLPALPHRPLRRSAQPHHLPAGQPRDGPALCRSQPPRRRGQRALQHAPPAPDRAQGGLQPQPIRRPALAC
eukprot:scaffold36758_cov54-Phaeocystis_antarctica.AAC.3